jgi:hypothetical protein
LPPWTLRVLVNRTNQGLAWEVPALIGGCNNHEIGGEGVGSERGIQRYNYYII